jgi:hypothetical protein
MELNVIVFFSVAVGGALIIGALFALVFRGLNRAVVSGQKALEEEQKSYSPGLTYGFKIPVAADEQAQLKAARQEAARRAAALPRGQNARIGTGEGEVKSAYKGLADDPISAVKMASVHSWEGLRAGASFSPAHAVTHAGAVTAPPTKTADDLVPGKDYEFIEVTDDMSPAEKRKARIANAKAKGAAVKALKEAAPVAAPAAARPAAPAAVATSQVAKSEPVAGVDYEVIEITDDMSPDEVKKARIANVKAKSAAMKAFKASGGAVAAAAPAPVAESAAVKEAEAVSSAAPVPAAHIPRPELIEITDGMDPAEVRRARIQNAKANAAYKKALKEAGIDPSTV